MHSALVIGAGGLLGRHLCQRLQGSARVVEASRKTGVDVTRSEPFAALEGKFDVVFNCAVAYEGQTLEELVAVNALGAERVARYALQCGAYLVHASTISTLGSAGDPLFGPYGMTKRLGDELVQYVAAHAQSSASVVRFSQLYDSDGVAKSSQPMLFRLIDQIREQGRATLYGNHDPVRNYLHVDDAAAIMMRVAARRLGGTWCAAHPESVTVSQLVVRIAAAFGKRAELRWLADKPDLPDIRIPSSDAQRLYQQLNWSPQVSLDQGLARLIHGH